MAVTLETLRAVLESSSEFLLDPHIPVAAVTADSRAVGPDSVFVAVPGVQVDGHDYIAQAVAQGARGVIGERPVEQVRDALTRGGAPVAYLRVGNARTALAWANAALRGFPSRALTVVGVTGTDGKTTTCTLIESILRFHTAARAGSDAQTRAPDAGAVGVITTVGARIRGRELDTGLHVTTPDAPQVQQFLAEMRDAGCSYAVVESTSHGLHQGRVAAVDFDVAAVTNITHEHLDYHGTREAYVAAKALLFRALFHAKLERPRWAVLNRDDAGSFDALQAVLDAEAAATPTTTAAAAPVHRRTYGLATGDVQARGVAYLPQATEFQVCWWDGEFPVRTPLIGEFNVYNILCAATVGLCLGVAAPHVQAGIEAVAGVSGRMERIDAGQPFLAVVDFAHSPVSLERALQTLRPLVGVRPGGAAGRLIAVFGSAGLRDRAKRRLMGAVSGRLADYTFVTAEDPRTEDLDAINREIAQGLEESGAAGRYMCIRDRNAAMAAAVAMAEAGDVVAAFGKGHERSMCFGAVEYPWSDQDALRDALLARPPSHPLPTA